MVKLSKKKDTSEILTKKYSRKRKYEKKRYLNDKKFKGAGLEVIDKKKLTYTYLLGLNFKQLNRNKFRRFLGLFNLKLRTEEEKIQMDIFRNGIKMMKYYQKFLKYYKIYRKIAYNLLKLVEKKNVKINSLILSLNKVLERIKDLESSIEDNNIIDVTNVLYDKIKYENEKANLINELMYKNDKSLFKKNNLTLKNPELGHLLYAYRKAEATFNHIFLKFNEKAVEFTNSFIKLKDHYNTKSQLTLDSTGRKKIEIISMNLSRLDIENFYNRGISYEFLPSNRQLKYTFSLKNFDPEDKLIEIINEWLTHYRSIIEDLPVNLQKFKEINNKINEYGVINNPFSKPYFHKEIKKQMYDSKYMSDNIQKLKKDLMLITDNSRLEEELRLIDRSERMAGGAIEENPQFLTPDQINNNIKALEEMLNSFMVNKEQFNLNKIEEMQVLFMKIIGSLIHLANKKSTHNIDMNNLINMIIRLVKQLNHKLLARDYDTVKDLNVLKNIFAEIIVKNQLNIIKNISIIISRLDELSSNKELLKKYRILRDEITQLNMKVTARIIKLNGGKPFDIKELSDDQQIQLGGARINQPNINFIKAKHLTKIKINILKKLILKILDLKLNF